MRIVPSREWWIFRRDWRNCSCGVLMSVRDGQKLGVSGSVSVRAKCLVSYINSEVCGLGYSLRSLAGRYVERSVTALFSSRSNCFIMFPCFLCFAFYFVCSAFFYCFSQCVRLFIFYLCAILPPLLPGGNLTAINKYHPFSTYTYTNL